MKTLLGGGLMGGAAGGMLILSAACVIKSIAMACFGVVVFMCGFSSSWASANWVRFVLHLFNDLCSSTHCS